MGGWWLAAGIQLKDALLPHQQGKKITVDDCVPGTGRPGVKIDNEQYINVFVLHVISLYQNAEQFDTPLIKKYDFNSSQALLQHMLI